jgi:hypothetical protein
MEVTHCELAAAFLALVVHLTHNPMYFMNSSGAYPRGYSLFNNLVESIQLYSVRARRLFTIGF